MKDRPYEVQVFDPKNRSRRRTRHNHYSLGDEYGKQVRVLDENNEPIYVEYEYRTLRLNTETTEPFYEFVTATRQHPKVEWKAVGVYADFCTAGVPPWELPHGVKRTCRDYLDRGGYSPNSSWVRAEVEEFWGGDRRNTRDWGRRVLKEHRGDPESVYDDDDTPLSDHRHGVVWNW